MRNAPCACATQRSVRAMTCGGRALRQALGLTGVPGTGHDGCIGRARLGLGWEGSGGFSSLAITPITPTNIQKNAPDRLLHISAWGSHSPS